jgi:hypothetical protein
MLLSHATDVVVPLHARLCLFGIILFPMFGASAAPAFASESDINGSMAAMLTVRLDGPSVRFGRTLEVL